MSKVLIIDNYDSFTWNLYQYFREIGVFVTVKRHDDIDILGIRRLSPDFLVISPGPGCPKNSGISLDVIRSFSGKIPIFGVCLGHQVIAQFFGAKIVRAKKVMHGKFSLIFHDKKGVFFGLKQYIRVIRYNSLIVDFKSIPSCLAVTAWSINEKGESNEVMGIRHRNLAVEGVQFHPESILSQCGKQLLVNFINFSKVNNT